MKVVKYVDVAAQVEVEIDISIEDIVSAINGVTDKVHHIASGLNNIHRFLSAVSDEMIEEMRPEMKEIAGNYLKAQSARFHA